VPDSWSTSACRRGKEVLKAASASDAAGDGEPVIESYKSSLPDESLLRLPVFINAEL
jgi:hypothetical protein